MCDNDNDVDDDEDDDKDNNGPSATTVWLHWEYFLWCDIEGVKNKAKPKFEKSSCAL